MKSNNEIRIIHEVFDKIGLAATTCACRSENPETGAMDVGDYFIEVKHPVN